MSAVIEVMTRLEEECGLRDIYREDGRIRLVLLKQPSPELSKLFEDNYQAILGLLPTSKQRRPGNTPDIVVASVTF